ncbi:MULTISPECIES: ABC transporter ATP-binding protein [unclassified Shewanella]|uniref:ABC transporter ATP-binding protein n=1 Tax=unclassified Shewanella TaxID=196818 RepID=UPI0020060C89|nr:MULTISPECIES: ABC transporter ATP-binding protein [unclassified Shewanella]MCK7633209.1 ABC transporter ATP-binding protein [Shewanella sp. JNE17]MCK7648191.1 ABC transporter ATP-binding protein [Shewanella sp. JNE8]MCK7656285.1 ABC transporter ATP-binding protein [Shewanella sp. JNE4-2]UPO32783.1 ABC transporter ATP-binding protein [Shewanella sp. JNE2]
MSLIQCQGLSKSYGSKQALNDVSFNLEAGAPIALVGPNGAGKTTLFSLLCGYLSPSAGTITLLGEAPNSPKLLGKIAALPQDAALDPNLTIASQLAFFARLQGMNAHVAAKEALRVLTLVDLAEVAQQKPPSLSHGMSKRVAIAQALIGSPQLVLLDEPTAGLDPANAKKVRELVKALSTTTTFMISSHNLDELEKLCDQVLYLDKGELSQSVSMRASTDSDYLTLTMQNCDSEKLLQEIAKLSGVINISSKQTNVFIIQLDNKDKHKEENFPTHYDIEIALLSLLDSHQWQYKMLLRGRTLEETLFS